MRNLESKYDVYIIYTKRIFQGDLVNVRCEDYLVCLLRCMCYHGTIMLMRREGGRVWMLSGLCPGSQSRAVLVGSSIETFLLHISFHKINADLHGRTI